jgi:riboflavin kinase/FMN adenylyltransferase
VDVIGELDALPAGLRFVATVGVFDGMHRGHRQVLTALVRLGAELAARPVVLTFHPHPQALISGSAPALLCDPAERLQLLAAAGVGTTIVARFDEAFRMQTADAFLHRLRAGRELRGLVMSSESAFGHDREGTVETARRLAAQEGWSLLQVPTLELDGARVSSGRIRSLVGAGQLAGARRLLGRPYAFSGRPDGVDVTGRGRLIEFMEPAALPRDGVYGVAVGRVHRQVPGLLRVADGSVALRRDDRSGWPEEDAPDAVLRIEFVRRVARERWTATRPA